MRKTVLNLLLITAIAIAPICILLLSYLHKLNELSGNFTREYVAPYTEVKTFNLGFNSYYIAGATDGDLYLGNMSIRPRLLKISMALRDTQTVPIAYDRKLVDTLTSYRCLLDSPNFFLLYGTHHLILKGKANEWAVTNSIPKIPYFMDAVPLPSGSFVFRFTDAITHENSFRKVLDDGSRIDNNTVLEKHVDGVICTSGILEYNKALNVLTYLYNYRNQILVLDTNLNLIRKIKTIDDIDSVRFTVSEIKSTGKRVITNPTILVNPRCATYKNYLLVQSKIMGQHEDNRQFEYSTVIDIYDVSNGSYLYSLSIYNARKININQMKIIGEYLYVMIGTYIQKYKITLPS